MFPLIGTNYHDNLENWKKKNSFDQKGCHSALKGISNLLMPSEMLMSSFILQVIQTVSAMDKDDPKNGHYFLYSLLPEMVNNPNFTIKKNEGKYISIVKQGKM